MKPSAYVKTVWDFASTMGPLRAAFMPPAMGAKPMPTTTTYISAHASTMPHTCRPARVMPPTWHTSCPQDACQPLARFVTGKHRATYIGY